MINQDKMDVFVFLEKLKVTDLQHPKYQFNNLIEYSKRNLQATPFFKGFKSMSAANTVEKPSILLPKWAQPKHPTVIIPFGGLGGISPEELNQSISTTSLWSKNATPHRNDNDLIFNAFKNRFSNLTVADLLNFDEFSAFSPRQEYLEDTSQVAVKYTSDQKKKIDKNDPYSPDNKIIQKAETTVKIKKIKIIGLLDLIVNLI